MAFIPRDRHVQPYTLSSGTKVFVVITGPPVPVPIDYWDEINGQSVLMRTLPRVRFRTSVGLEVCLPVREAQSLEDTELSLRLANLISFDECLVQEDELSSHLKVQQIQEGYTVSIHDVTSFRGSQMSRLAHF